MKRVILVGDSIRMYYTPAVVEQLDGVAEVISPEEIGGDSRNVLANLDGCVIAQQPDIVHLNCGLHDLKREFETPERNQVPLAEYEANLRAIFTRLREATRATLIWATITPVNYERHHEVKGFDRLEQDVVDYNAAALQIAREFGAVINDLYAFVMEHGRDEMLCFDGVHYTDEAARVQGVRVAEVIRSFV